MNTKPLFQVIVVDPPYLFSDNLNMSDVKRSSKANYNVMNIEQISKLKIKDISDPGGSLLALWVPSSLLQSGLNLMNGWGFTHKQTWVWVKVKNDPFAKLKRQKNIDWENFNWNDFLSFKNKSQRTVFFYKNTKHSRKPELLQDKLELMFPDQNYLEIFGRRKRLNWSVIGNESPETFGEDIFDNYLFK